MEVLLSTPTNAKTEFENKTELCLLIYYIRVTKFWAGGRAAETSIFFNSIHQINIDKYLGTYIKLQEKFR